MAKCLNLIGTLVAIFVLMSDAMSTAQLGETEFTEVVAQNVATHDGSRNILIMFQGCGQKSSLFQIGLTLGEALRSRGNNVTLVVTQTNDSTGTSVDHDGEETKGFRKIVIDSERVTRDCGHTKRALGKGSLSARKDIAMQQLPPLLAPLMTGCDVLLSNQSAMSEIRELNLDLIIGESFGSCYVILSRLLGGVPFAHFLVVSPEVLPPAMFPQTASYMHDRSIFERLGTIVEQISVHLFYYRMFTGFSHVARTSGVTSLGSPSKFAAAYKNASLWFVNGDPVLDYPLPVPANVVFMGDLLPHPPRVIVDKELNSTLEQLRFIDSKLLVVSTNTLASSHLAGEVDNKLTAALERLPLDTLWRNSKRKSEETQRISKLKAKDVALRPRGKIHYTGWLNDNDMNDLLGLDNTVAFITTGGRCGVMEAIYHGVPALCLPLYSEHLENCRKLVDLGMAIVLDLHSFTAEQIHDSIMMLTQNTSYEENASRASSIFRSKPMPAEDRAAFWVDHVIQHRGAHHLVVPGDGSLLELVLNMVLNLGLVLVLIVLSFAWLFWKLLRLILWFISRRHQIPPKRRQKTD